MYIVAVKRRVIVGLLSCILRTGWHHRITTVRPSVAGGTSMLRSNLEDGRVSSLSREKVPSFMLRLNLEDG